MGTLNYTQRNKIFYTLFEELFVNLGKDDSASVFSNATKKQIKEKRDKLIQDYGLTSERDQTKQIQTIANRIHDNPKLVMIPNPQSKFEWALFISAILDGVYYGIWAVIVISATFLHTGLSLAALASISPVLILGCTVLAIIITLLVAHRTYTSKNQSMHKREEALSEFASTTVTNNARSHILRPHLDNNADLGTTFAILIYNLLQVLEPKDHESDKRLLIQKIKEKTGLNEDDIERELFQPANTSQQHLDAINSPPNTLRTLLLHQAHKAVSPGRYYFVLIAFCLLVGIGYGYTGILIAITLSHYVPLVMNYKAVFMAFSFIIGIFSTYQKYYASQNNSCKWSHDFSQMISPAENSENQVAQLTRENTLLKMLLKERIPSLKGSASADKPNLTNATNEHSFFAEKKTDTRVSRPRSASAPEPLNRDQRQPLETMGVANSN